MPSKKTLAVLLGATTVLAAATLFGVFVLYRLWVLDIHNQIGAGMTIQDVTTRLGEPDRITKPGNPLDPPHVSGFTPDTENTNVVYTYFLRGVIVYVFFDEQDRVAVYYVCRS